METNADRDKIIGQIFLLVKKTTRQEISMRKMEEEKWVVVELYPKDYTRFPSAQLEIHISPHPQNHHFRIRIQEATGLFAKYQSLIRKQLRIWEQYPHQVLGKDQSI